jgi:excisionase family DNA binding protein
MEENLWDTEKVAEYLGISFHSVRGKVSRKEIPHIKCGRRTLFSPQDIRTWVQGLKVAVKEK